MMTTVLTMGGLAMTGYAADYKTMVGGEPHPMQVQANDAKAVTTPSPALEVVTVAEGLAHPWSLAFLPDNGMLVTERNGFLRYFSGPKAKPLTVQGLPVEILVSGQAGLFEILPARDFAESGRVFFSYASPVPGGNALKVATATLDRKAATPVLRKMEVIFTSTPPIDDDKNLGGKLLEQDDGTLLVTVGDFFAQDLSQDMSSTLGKVVRINPDGTVPNDNPFVGREGVRPEIFSVGNRNVQGIARRPGTNEIWMNEHGPKGGDEVNILQAGANYAWPLATYGVDYSGKTITKSVTRSGTVDPVLHWTPSIAPSGMAFYTGDAIPAWKGDAFVGMLAGQQLRRLEIKDDQVVGEEALLSDLGARIREVRMGPDGYLYVLTDADNGKLLRLVPRE